MGCVDFICLKSKIKQTTDYLWWCAGDGVSIYAFRYSNFLFGGLWKMLVKKKSK